MPGDVLRAQCPASSSNPLALHLANMLVQAKSRQDTCKENSSVGGNIQPVHNAHPMIEVVPELCKGACFLKFPTSGLSKPHVRYFVLSTDCQTIFWFSNAKTFEQSQYITSITRTSDLSFSINYGIAEVVHLRAKTAMDYQLWTQGLNGLRKGASKTFKIPCASTDPVLWPGTLPLTYAQSLYKFAQCEQIAKAAVFPFANPFIKQIRASLYRQGRSVNDEWLFQIQVEAVDQMLRTRASWWR